MPLIKFSIPYNVDFDLMKWAVDSGHIDEIYFAGSRGYDFSSPYQNQNKHTAQEIGRLIRFCAKRGIRKNLLINKSIFFFDNIKILFSYITGLSRWGGIDAISLADPALAPFLKARFPDITLQSSVFMGIDSAPKVMEALKMGISEFCLGVSTNRNAKALSEIRDLKKAKSFKVKLLANHGCYRDCFYAAKHPDWPLLAEINAKKGRSRTPILGDLLELRKCVYRWQRHSDEIKRPFIRPEDIPYFEKNDFADFIKLAYRQDHSKNLRKKMMAYFTKTFDGNLLEVIPSNKVTAGELYCDNKSFPSNFVKKVTECDFKCYACDYCERVAALTIRKWSFRHKRHQQPSRCHE